MIKLRRNQGNKQLVEMISNSKTRFYKHAFSETSEKPNMDFKRKESSKEITIKGVESETDEQMWGVF